MLQHGTIYDHANELPSSYQPAFLNFTELSTNVKLALGTVALAVALTVSGCSSETPPQIQESEPPTPNPTPTFYQHPEERPALPDNTTPRPSTEAIIPDILEERLFEANIDELFAAYERDKVSPEPITPKIHTFNPRDITSDPTEGRNIIRDQNLIYYIDEVRARQEPGTIRPLVFEALALQTNRNLAPEPFIMVANTTDTEFKLGLRSDTKSSYYTIIVIYQATDGTYYVDELTSGITDANTTLIVPIPPGATTIFAVKREAQQVRY